MVLIVVCFVIRSLKTAVFIMFTVYALAHKRKREMVIVYLTAQKIVDGVIMVSFTSAPSF